MFWRGPNRIGQPGCIYWSQQLRQNNGSTSTRTLGCRSQALERTPQRETETRETPRCCYHRRDLISVPIPSARLLWQNLRVRDVQRVNNQQRTQNIRMDIIVEGVTFGRKWTCGLEFDYANEESFYCRPLRLTEGDAEALQRMAIPKNGES